MSIKNVGSTGVPSEPNHSGPITYSTGIKGEIVSGVTTNGGDYSLSIFRMMINDVDRWLDRLWKAALIAACVAMLVGCAALQGLFGSTPNPDTNGDGVVDEKEAQAAKDRAEARAAAGNAEAEVIGGVGNAIYPGLGALAMTAYAAFVAWQRRKAMAALATAVAAVEASPENAQAAVKAKMLTTANASTVKLINKIKGKKA